jgi:hypothetical protein
MNIYTLDNYQNHCIVAEDMASAVRAWKKKYGDDPEKLQLISKHVLIADESTTKEDDK